MVVGHFFDSLLQCLERFAESVESWIPVSSLVWTNLDGSICRLFIRFLLSRRLISGWHFETSGRKLQQVEPSEPSYTHLSQRYLVSVQRKPVYALESGTTCHPIL